MARRQFPVMLPPEHIYALHLIAEKRGLPMSEIVHEAILSNMAAGVIPDETPGVNIFDYEDGGRYYGFLASTQEPAHLALPMTLGPLTRSGLLRVAEVVEAVATRTPLPVSEPLAPNETGEAVAPVGMGYVLGAGETEMKVGRVGGGVVIAQGKRRRVFAVAVALDVVRQIRKAAVHTLAKETAKAA